MRILLDECIDRRLARDILGHEVRTVAEMGWAAMKNSKLLGVAEKNFDVFLTVDRNLPFQQNLQKFNISVVVLTGLTTRLKDLRPLIPNLLKILPSAKRGEVVSVGI